jgi:hypothetical protein
MHSVPHINHIEDRRKSYMAVVRKKHSKRFEPKPSKKHGQLDELEKLNSKRIRIKKRIQTEGDNAMEAIGRKREHIVFKALDLLMEEKAIKGYVPSGKLSDADLQGVDAFVVMCDESGNRMIVKMGIGNPRFVHEQRDLYPNVLHIPVDAQADTASLKELIRAELELWVDIHTAHAAA